MSLRATLNRAKEYQGKVEGRYMLVADMTLEQLQEALCDAYDFIDELAGVAFETNEKIETWQNK